MKKNNNLFDGSEKLWQNIKPYALKAGRESARIVLDLYYVLKSPNTPFLDKTLIFAALGYQLLPDDLITSENHGLFGALDNVATLTFAYNKVKARITPQIESQVDAVLSQWFGDFKSDTANNLENSSDDETLFLEPPTLSPQKKPTEECNENEEVVID